MTLKFEWTPFAITKKWDVMISIYFTDIDSNFCNTTDIPTSRTFSIEILREIPLLIIRHCTSPPSGEAILRAEMLPGCWKRWWHSDVTSSSYTSSPRRKGTLQSAHCLAHGNCHQVRSSHHLCNGRSRMSANSPSSNYTVKHLIKYTLCKTVINSQLPSFTFK